MEKTNQDRYGLDTGIANAFYYIYSTENNPYIAPICGNIAEYSKRGKEYSQFFFNKPYTMYILILGYLVLSVLSIVKLINFNKNA